MSTKKFQLRISGFSDGLNTEASALNVLPSEFMEGSKNIELLQNGSIRRRKCVDWIGETASTGGGFLQLLRTNSVGSELKQESPAGVFIRLNAPNGDIVERIVVDLDNEFHVFEPTQMGLKSVDVPLQILTRGTNSSSLQKFTHMEYAASGGKLYFAGKHTQPGYITVDSDNTSLIITYYDVLIRDVNATTTGSRVTNNSKYYECIESHTSGTDSEPGVGSKETQFWQIEDIPIPGGAAGWAISTSYTSTFIKQYDRNVDISDTDTFPETVEFFAGRVWLSGDVKNPNTQFFSQVVVSDLDIPRFHAFADPFDSADPDIVADDGGVLQIQGAGLTHKLEALSTALFIGTNTGVWQISGPGGVFKATDFSNSIVLKDGIDGPGNMLIVDKELVVFGQDAVWRSTLNKNLASTEAGAATFDDISIDRVQTLYDAVPKRNKAAARAVYNASEGKVFWFHNRTRTDFDKSFNPDNEPGYSKDMLVLDARFDDTILQTASDVDKDIKRSVKQAWTLYDLADTAANAKPYIAAPFVANDVPAADEDVVDLDANTVTDVDGVEVVAGGHAEAKDAILFLGMRRATASGNTSLYRAFGTMKTANYVDWFSDNVYQTGYVSRVIGGFQTLADVLLRKSVTYVYFVFKRVESNILDSDFNDISPGSCFFRAGSQWAQLESQLDNQTAEMSKQTQIYQPDRFTYSNSDGSSPGHSHAWYKHRVRGRGNAISFLFESVADVAINTDPPTFVVDASGNEVTDKLCSPLIAGGQNDLLKNANGDRISASGLNKDFQLVGWSEQFFGTGQS